MLNHDNLNAPRPGQVPPPDPARHSRKCEVCRHPDRQAIEQEFLRWRHPDNILDDYELNSRSSIYRHAHATGLLAQRRLNLRDSLELVIEQAEQTTPTADSIIRAVRAHSCITEEGRWIEPAKHVIISRRDISDASPAEAARIPKLEQIHQSTEVVDQTEAISQFVRPPSRTAEGVGPSEGI
jgi:hypothetical protein